MKTVAVVPMKLNNKRLPQKNTKAFTNGKPLCTYILETLKKVEGVDKIYVYCSNSDIKEYLPDGIEYLKRDERLDLDSTSMIEVLKAFSEDIPADIYLMTHTTAPFVKTESIQLGLDNVISGKFDSSFAAKVLQDFLWVEGENKPYNYDLNNIPRTQDLKPFLMETSGFYIYTKEVIKGLGRRIGEHPFVVKVGEIESIDIDEAEDFLIADAIFNYMNR
ncbi:CMP-N-acetylneuraminic acid synthetase [Pseudobutyrivibrio sp. UC1225]|uniref:acylneuraminate cytidylyltransferase family protein n=1 Tax=Pseudobutyrivibrio sp. UC1225 TaxID=1798185 RepID=UPI0008E2199F|nr:acylneuraminate cytidylyltransferase family protein [Pseudobutyrivibrio sp. UC1225]SFN79165.1 CMP-N-acetylneuraminic acid synthetase [Pseudobutyrivibrio sp. UC1225]